MEGALSALANLLLRAVRRGLVFGAVVAVAVTVFVTTWEWLENPGGIFRDEAGTNWRFIRDTAISWLLPTFVYSAAIGAAVSVGYFGVRRLLLESKGSGD